MNLVKFQDTELIHRFLLHSYPLKMKNLNKIKVTILFTITSKRKKKKPPRKTSPNEAKDRYSENSKILMKEIKNEQIEKYNMIFN